jgi:transposase
LKIGLNIRVKGWHTEWMTVLRSQQATNWREGRRLRAWELFQEGWPQQRIAEALGVSKGAVSQWLSRAKLTHQQRLQLLELLTQGPQALGFRGDVWTQPRVAQIIRRHFGVHYHLSQVGRILKQYAWSRQKPLRRASQRDETAIRHWKEERWLRNTLCRSRHSLCRKRSRGAMDRGSQLNRTL